MDQRIRPFTAHVDAAQIEDLKTRLARTRWPEAQTCTHWSQGVPLAYAQELANYWATDYDWRRAEAQLNSWPQLLLELELDDQRHTIHCLHRRSSNPKARPLLITHGWPGSVFEFAKIIEPLAEPQAHGGNTEDAFHIIAPSLPGYGFSSKPSATGSGVEHIADLWNVLMLALGYEHYFAQGGDWGSMVTSALGQRHPQHCDGIHLNMVVSPPDPDTLDALQPQEQRSLAALDHYAKWDSGYSKIQSTRPQTLGYGLADSPVAQMAWIVEKLWAWTDCERDGLRHPEHVLSRDEILDNISLYWFSNSAASSARLYWESFNAPNLEPVEVPMGGSSFPRDIFLCSERWAKKRFPGLVYWNELDRGGHFAALEQPGLFIDEVRNCFRLMR